MWEPHVQQSINDITGEPFVKINDNMVNAEQIKKAEIPEPSVEKEPEIQVLMGNNFDQEYDETSQQYAVDTLPGHLPEGVWKLRSVNII